MKQVLVSIIIATFNSEKILSLVLNSITRQNFDKDKLEVLIVDGGSTDSTLDLCKKNHCRILHNKKGDPINAKILGFQKALGRYHVYLDHDEVLENKNSLTKKLHAMSHKNVYAVAGSGYKNPIGYPIVNKYINEFGDPFSFFIYRLSKDWRFFNKIMRKRYPILKETKEFSIFDLSNVSQLPLLELVAGGTMIDSNFFKRNFLSQTTKIYFLGQAFNLMWTINPFIAVTKNDNLIHYSSDNTRRYLSKIKWRIRNNIFFKETAGKAAFLGRESHQPKIIQMKKYLFIPYSFSVILPLLDAVFLSITRKDYFYMIHLPLTLYTGAQIVHLIIIKWLDIKIRITNYDGTKKK